MKIVHWCLLIALAGCQGAVIAHEFGNAECGSGKVSRPIPKLGAGMGPSHLDRFVISISYMHAK